ncbi:MAG: DNA cytosine methyltransferase [Opitutales bacterium]|nr:DNA cytosine methyltransferase [Opitutales bacterium]
MKSDRPIGVDLFAGAGGLSLGFEQAGFDVPAAVEIDPVHASVHHYNFPECTVHPVGTPWTIFLMRKLSIIC